MKKILPVLLLSIFMASAFADDQTRQVQSALSQAGFYYGKVDGEMGEETRAALRRFQIRNGLDVSGSMSPETLAALKVEKQDAPTSAAEDEQQIAATTKAPEAFLAPNNTRAERPTHSQVASRTLPTPNEPVSVPVTRERSPVREYFSDTELSRARPDDQTAALMDAQRRLARLGYYRGAPTGLPGAETEEALLRFQHSLHLRLTGQLDDDTRQALIDAPPSVPAKPFRSSHNRPDGAVLRGIWMR